MSSSLASTTLEGKIIEILETKMLSTKKVDKNNQKIEIEIKTLVLEFEENKGYLQHLEVNFYNKKIEQIKSFKQGDYIEVICYVKGSSYYSKKENKTKYATSLTGYTAKKIEPKSSDKKDE